MRLSTSHIPTTNHLKKDNRLTERVLNIYNKKEREKEMFEKVPDNFRVYPEKDIKLPTRSTKYSAGYDFYSPIAFSVPPKSSTPLIFTDVCVELKPNQFLQITPRSSIGIKKGVILKNTLGIVDCDYYKNISNYGNICFIFYNYSDETAYFEEGERIMQGIILEYHTFENEEENLKERIGGFGSSGR